MKKLLIPLVLLLVGVGGGVGAGLALSPAPAEEEMAALANPCGDVPAAGSHAAEEAPAEDATDEGEEPGTAGRDYVRLNNQFVVPVVEGSEVASLVLLSLSVETPAGQQDAVLMIEPKLRDAFLQVLFDHANTGGFEGMFTAASAMRTLRAALLRAAQAEAGDLVTDVLIVELVRQDA
jgi:flagellar FliL protein